VDLNFPDTPVTVILWVPGNDKELVVNVRTLLLVVGLGLKDAVVPLPIPVADNFTAPVKPPDGKIVIVVVA
jgi:hypothetical protein